MAINPDRPVITYEKVAVFQSDTPAHSGVSNSGQNLSFLPLVQSINFSTDVARTNVGAIGTKDFIDQSNRTAPDVNFSINTIENFGKLFLGLYTGSGIRDDLNTDRNFYAALGRQRGFDVSGDSLTGIEMLSFGNCFLNDVSISQSVRGLLTSQYSYIGSNMQAETLGSIGTTGTGLAPSIDLTGDQSQSIVCRFDEMSQYYSNNVSGIIPSYNTDVLISGNGSLGNFLIKSDSIQNFDLNLSINRKTINSLGKKYPVKRKALFPIPGSFSFSNFVSSFELTGPRSNLKDFLSSDEDYSIHMSGQSIEGDSFNFQIQKAKLTAQSQESAIGATVSANLRFSFELNDFTGPIIGASVSSFALASLSYTNADDPTTFRLQPAQYWIDGRPLYSFSRGSPFDDAGEIRWSDSSVAWIFKYYPSVGMPTPSELFPSASRTDRDTPYPFLDSNGDIRSEFTNLVFS